MADKPYLILDIETLGLSYQAPIFAIALLDHRGYHQVAQLNIDPQIARGAIPSHDCMYFWLQQEDNGWLDAYPMMTPESLLQTIENCYQSKSDVWVRGNFDIGCLGAFFHRFGLGPDRDWHPWHYRKLHNIRTAELLTGPNKQALKTHDPLQDCTDDKWIVDKFYDIQNTL